MLNDKMIKCGFIKDENNFQFNEVFRNNVLLKQIHIDVLSNNPMDFSCSFMLLLRADETNAKVYNDNDRVILVQNDTLETHFMNILLSKITECFVKVSETYSEFILSIQNIYYRITVLN